MGRTLILVAALTALTTLAVPTAAQQAPSKPVNYEELGRAFLKDLGEVTPPTLPDLLARHYTRLALGDFDLQMPTRMLGKAADVARVAAIAEALLDLQDRLLELTTEPDELKTKRAEMVPVRKYVASWRSKPTSADASGLPQQKEPCVLVIAPDRKNFVGLVGWLGLYKQTYRDFWWNDATAQFSDLRVQDEGHVQVVALEYAAPDQNGDVTLGFDMNTRERTGMLQHVLQRAAVSWCWRRLGDEADMSFLLGFATDLVVDVLGQNNARSGGSGKSSSTEGVNAFIPGAPGAGGGMQMVNADSAWRLSQGQDYFARVLRQAQKAGEHEAADSKDKLGHFLLRLGGKTHRVDAPFLGKIAYDREDVPTAFLDDYLEFHRAYRAGFVHWLETHGAKAKAPSMERFRTLLQRLMAQKAGESFDMLCEQLYGVPVAAKPAAADTLERRFLAWIADSSR